MHIILIGAHPDDETFASGTIAKYVQRGHEATIIHATRGGKGHWDIPVEELRKIRAGEMERAAEVLGADLKFLDFEDACVPEGDLLREAFVQVYREVKPDIVLTFHPFVWRDDHRRVGLAACDACLKASLPLHVTEYPAHRPEPEVYFFGTTMNQMEPDTYIDITEVIDVKVEAFRQHRSQWVEWGKPHSMAYLEKQVQRYKNRFRVLGRKAGVMYAEAFISKTGRGYAHDLLPVRR